MAQEDISGLEDTGANSAAVSRDLELTLKKSHRNTPSVAELIRLPRFSID